MAIKHIDPVYIYNLLHDVQKDYQEQVSVDNAVMAERVHLLSKVVESLVDALLELQAISEPGQEEDLEFIQEPDWKHLAESLVFNLRGRRIDPNLIAAMLQSAFEIGKQIGNHDDGR